MVSLFARTTRRVGMGHIRYVTPVTAGAATGMVARVYQDVERDFGMLAPPLALHAAAPDVLAAAWLMLRGTLLAPGRVSREVKEAVAAAVSQVNRCPYCVEVHGTTLAGLLRTSAAVAVDGHLDAVTDPQLREAVRWASGTATPQTGAGLPFPQAEVPELIGVAVTFHYINRMVNVFLSDSPLPPVPAVALRPVRYIARRILGGLARAVPHSPRCPDLLPDAPLPADLAWAGTAPSIADTFARASAAIEAGGTRTVPAGVRRLVTDTIAGHGDAARRSVDRAWLDRTLGGLPDDERPAARLALLTALGSYQVTPAVVAGFLARGNDDQALIELTAWASLAAARTIGDRLYAGGQLSA